MTRIDAKGRCCGLKPLVYKREPHLFCHRCCRAYDPVTLLQIPNWAWIKDAAGDLIAKYPKEPAKQ